MLKAYSEFIWLDRLASGEKAWQNLIIGFVAYMESFDVKLIAVCFIVFCLSHFKQDDENQSFKNYNNLMNGYLSPRMSIVEFL